MGTFPVDRGPVSWSFDGWVSGGSAMWCGHDLLNADPVSGEEPLDLQYDTPPPAFNGLLIAQTFGCLSCAVKVRDEGHSNTPPPTGPSAQIVGAIHYTTDPVNTATGTLTEGFTDVSLPGPGIPFELLRSYNSRDTTSGPMGQGWTLPFL